MSTSAWQTTASPTEDADILYFKKFDRYCCGSAAGQDHYFPSIRNRSPILIYVQECPGL